MPRKESIFGDVHASSVKDIRLGTFWFTRYRKRILKLKVLNEVYKTDSLLVRSDRYYFVL